MPCVLGAAKRELTRRETLRGLGSAGMAAAGMAALPGAAGAALFPKGVLIEDATKAFEAAGGPKLGELAPFRITGQDLPWNQKLMQVADGQKVTFLLSGRWHLSREADIWFEPGVVFHARAGSEGRMFNPSRNTGTMTAERDGRIEIARSAGEWANAKGETWTPEEAYLTADGEIEGVAIAWRGDPRDGLASMAQVADPGGLIGKELRRLAAPPQTPEGWQNHFSFGESGVFSTCGDEICCETRKDVAILQRDIAQPLEPGLALNWRWLVSELPSQAPENVPLSHDYLSIGVEFDDGQDITYLWSHELPVGEAFRCPLPGWNAIETHVVQRSGRENLGQWFPESADIAADYGKLIGGDATEAVRIWLLGVSVFQRRAGACRYADISLEGPAGRSVIL